MPALTAPGFISHEVVEAHWLAWRQEAYIISSMSPKKKSTKRPNETRFIKLKDTLMILRKKEVAVETVEMILMIIEGQGEYRLYN